MRSVQLANESERGAEGASRLRRSIFMFHGPRSHFYTRERRERIETMATDCLLNRQIYLKAAVPQITNCENDQLTLELF